MRNDRQVKSRTILTILKISTDKIHAWWERCSHYTDPHACTTKPSAPALNICFLLDPRLKSKCKLTLQYLLANRRCRLTGSPREPITECQGKYRLHQISYSEQDVWITNGRKIMISTTLIANYPLRRIANLKMLMPIPTEDEGRKRWIFNGTKMLTTAWVLLLNPGEPPQRSPTSLAQKLVWYHSRDLRFQTSSYLDNQHLLYFRLIAAHSIGHCSKYSPYDSSTEINYLLALLVRVGDYIEVLHLIKRQTLYMLSLKADHVQSH